MSPRMEIIGRGFLGTNHEPIAPRHPHVTMIAAGVSSTAVTDAELFRAEREMVADIAARCARTGRQVVLFSTASHAMYGNTSHAVTEDEAITPHSAFGRHKLDLEHVVADSGAPWLIIRLSHAIGPHQRQHQLFPSMVRLVRSGAVTVYRDNHRDLMDVAEAVGLLDALLADGVTGEVVNIASGVPQPTLDLVHAIEAALGVTAAKTGVAAEPMRTLVSLAKLHKLVPASADPRGEDFLRRLVARYAALY